MIDNMRLMTQAALLRKRLGEDNDSPIDIFSLALSIENLTIVYYPFGDNLSGMCIKGQEGNNLVAINSAMTLGRQRFSLAHEFYHLNYDDKMVSICGKAINSGTEIEKSADRFASYFLMPETSLIGLAERYVRNRPGQQLTLNDVIRIEQYFGVSHQAAVYRLMDTPYLKSSTGNGFLNISVRQKAESLGYNSDLYRKLPENKQYMTYGHYIDQAAQIISEDLVSYGKYEELLLDAFRSDLVYGGEEEGDIID